MKNWKRAWREKCNPGSRYRKRLEPVFPGRLDLRSRRDVITEEEGKSADRRTERRKKRGKKKGNKKQKEEVKVNQSFECRVTHPLILLLYQNNAPAARRISSNSISTAISMETVPAHKELKTNSLIKQNSRNLCYQRHSGRADSRPPEPEASLLATDSQRCPSQPGEHLHTNTDTNTRWHNKKYVIYAVL